MGICLGRCLFTAHQTKHNCLKGQRTNPNARLCLEMEVTNDSRTGDVGNLGQNRGKAGCVRLMTENQSGLYSCLLPCRYLPRGGRGASHPWIKGKGCGANCKGSFPLPVAVQCQDLSPPDEQSPEVAAANLPTGQGSPYQFPAQHTGIASQHVMDHRVVSCTGKEHTRVTCCSLTYFSSESDGRFCYGSFP